MGDEDEDAADREDEQERVLGVRPEAGRVDDRPPSRAGRPSSRPGPRGRRRPRARRRRASRTGRGRRSRGCRARRRRRRRCADPRSAVVEAPRERGAQDDPEEREVERHDDAEPCREPGVGQRSPSPGCACPATRIRHRAAILARRRPERTSPGRGNVAPALDGTRTPVRRRTTGAGVAARGSRALRGAASATVARRGVGGRPRVCGRAGDARRPTARRWGGGGRVAQQARARANGAARAAEISELDKRIIEHLQQDGRRPFTQIAADLGRLRGGRPGPDEPADRAGDPPGRRRHRPAQARLPPAGDDRRPLPGRPPPGGRPRSSPSSPRSTTSS